ncbi:MAG: hypothetical protein U1C97_03260, partial [Candidatus Gracilibacteria bacterium]|nr:hypothetical protein [Candidatus Gracilibacteria bacterium]
MEISLFLSVHADTINESEASVKQELRKRLTDCLQSIRTFNGFQKGAEMILECIIAVEDWQTKVFGCPLKGEEEKEALASVLGKQVERSKRYSIDGLLSRTIERLGVRLRKKMKSAIEGKSPELLKDILIIPTDQIFLPPGEGEIQPGNGGLETKEFQYHNRLSELIWLLNSNGIDSDDIIIVTGKVSEKQVRQEPYYLVEIPRLKRQVLICNQVGEATYLIRGMFSRKTLAQCSKKELLEKYPEKVVKVLYREKKEWEAQMSVELFAQGPETKQDLNKRERFRQEILKQKLTAEDWVAMKGQEKSTFSVRGQKLKALVRLFGVEGDPVGNHRVHLELGLKLYGEENEVILRAILEWEESHQILSEEEARAEILKQKPAAEDWVAMKQKEKLSFSVRGLKLSALATLFRVEGKPINKHRIHLELGLRVYGGENEDILKAIQEWEKAHQNLSQEEAKTEILSQKLHAEDWVAMKVPEKRTFSIRGQKLKALATLFGVKGDPVGNHR